jgi:hypothetical protein
MTLPLPDWVPAWVQLALLVLGLLFGFAFLMMPFAVFGIKGRLEMLESQLEDVHAELRMVAMRLSVAERPEPELSVRPLDLQAERDRREPQTAASREMSMPSAPVPEARVRPEPRPERRPEPRQPEPRHEPDAWEPRTTPLRREPDRAPRRAALWTPAPEFDEPDHDEPPVEIRRARREEPERQAPSFRPSRSVASPATFERRDDPPPRDAPLRRRDAEERPEPTLRWPPRH